MSASQGSTIVLKFGGTSVGTPGRIRMVAQRVAATWEQRRQVVVVVSAMGSTTDELIELARKVSDRPPHREMDMLLTAGERISMALLSMALSDLGVPALSFTGSQSGIITTGNHRRARIQKILGDRVRAALIEEKVAIVAGFQGVSASREITTLGRGGSDTTAVALAAALRADDCEIYTDVDGVYSADPRIVPGARFYPSIRQDWMLELATLGAGVLHPRSVELARKYRVAVRVKNSLMAENEPGERSGGTLVEVAEIVKGSGAMDSAEEMEAFRVVGVTADSDKFGVIVRLARPTVMGAVCDAAAQQGLVILSPVFSDHEFRFFADRDGEEDWRKALDQLVVEGFLADYEFKLRIVPLSVVGSGFAQDCTALSQMMDALAQEKISVTIGSASALSMTVGVPEEKATDGIQALHRRFIEGGS